MKISVTFLIAFLFYFAAVGQCENAYFPFEGGMTFELTSYKPNGKETGKIKNRVTDATNDKVIVKNEIYDKKGNLINDGEYAVICDNGTIKMDMRGVMPDEAMKDLENMEMSIEGDFLEIPGDLQVGQELPDGTGTIHMKMAQGGMNINTQIDFTYTDRKVETEETINTPAGTFDAYKITQTTNIDSKIMGMSGNHSSTSATWVAEGVGTVKSESYDKKGEVESYTLLTSFGK